MLQSTFCHLPGIGPKKEQAFWNKGIVTWRDMRLALDGNGGGGRLLRLAPALEESILQHGLGNPAFFADLLAPSEAWRLFGEYRHSVAYVDIETTGGTPGEDHITTIALYDGRDVFTYVWGENLDRFEEDVSRYKLLVTFNGRCFDAPVIERDLGIKLTKAHIDLRFVLRGLGITGGLKRCEERFGIDREGLSGVDGYFAVLFWNEFERTGDPSILETLIAYNVADVLSLEHLLHLAYNMRLEQTPFSGSLVLEVPPLRENPCTAHPEVVEKARENLSRGRFRYW
jgi:uncharacterized protein